MRPQFLALAFSALLCGCVYRMNIQQGNYLENKKIEQVQTGMTRSQVRYLLGTPMVPDAFDNERWDYVYYLKKGRLKKSEQRHLVVYFQEDKVTRLDRVSMPDSGSIPLPDPLQPVPKTDKNGRPIDEPASTEPENPGTNQPGAPPPPEPPPQA